MTFIEKIQYKSIARQIAQAEEQGFGGLTINYTFYFPSLPVSVRRELKRNGVNISEMDWGDHAWRRYYWGKGVDKVKKK